MTEGSVARRYAKALLDLGRDEKVIDRLGDDLDRFLRTANANGGQLIGAMTNPGFTHAERRGVLDQVLPGMALHRYVLSFIRLLLDKDRFGALPDIAREYRGLADLEAGRVRAFVTTATALTPELKAEVNRALQALTGKTVVMEAKVDPALIGGMVARVGSKVYDASLRSRLEQIQLSLSIAAQG